MRVLEDSLAGAWPRQVKCSQCKSRLEIELDDLRYDSWKVSGYHFDGSAQCVNKYTFRCPICGREANGNEILEEDIPVETRQKLREGIANG